MRVLVHYNLRTLLWSITKPSTRRVVDHLESLCLLDLDFKVSAAGLARVRGRRRRTVIAWAEGVLIPYRPPPASCLQIRFNPFRDDRFVDQHGAPCPAGGIGYFAPAGKAFVGVSEGYAHNPMPSDQPGQRSRLTEAADAA
jgi:hypothetical protein